MQLQIFKISFCSILGAIVSYFQPTLHILAVMSALVILDWLTGIWASRKNKIPITSRRLVHSVVKWVCYLVAVESTFLAQESLNLGFNLFKFVAGYIYGCELISLFENLATISKNKIFVKIIAAVRGKSEDIKDSLLNDMKNK